MLVLLYGPLQIYVLLLCVVKYVMPVQPNNILVMINTKKKKKNLPHRELNPGRPRDRRKS